MEFNITNVFGEYLKKRTEINLKLLFSSRYVHAVCCHFLA